MKKKMIEINAFEFAEKVQDAGMAVQAALSTLNPVTNAIFTAFSEWNSRKSMRQLQIMIQRLSDRLTALEDYHEEYLQSDEFKELLYKTCHKVVADLREEKAILFGDFLAGSAVDEEITSSDSFMILEVLDKIELEHLAFMTKMESRTFDPQEKVAGWTSDEGDLMQLGVSEERFFLLSEYLSNLGLVTRLEKFTVDNGSIVMWRESFLSGFGKKVIGVMRGEHRRANYV
jgi:hypothetical protein